MHTLTDEICKAFPNLKELRVYKLSITQIAPNALDHCRQLTLIGFWQNELEQFDQYLFQKNHKLTSISFHHNNLKSIDGKIFVPVQQLKQLFLGENLLHRRFLS